MQNALLFSPDLEGHRQVYIYIFVDILQELGFKIYIACNDKQEANNSFYIDKLKENCAIIFFDTSIYDKGGLNIKLQEFLDLQNTLQTDLTIFLEADHHFSLFISQIYLRKRLRGKVIGLFMRPFFYYNDLSIIDQLRRLKHLPERWRNDEKLFYKFFLKKFYLLDVPLTLDENLISSHPKFKWLPDVFQKYAEDIIKSEKTEDRIWIERLNKFKESNRGKFVFLYFGTAQNRRGYDTLLNLAEKTGECFVHCGLRNNFEEFDYDINTLRSSLNSEGRLFETDQYLTDPLTIKYFFKSISHLVLPYKKFYGSSGIMLQALELGIPVLTPDSGIIGYRTSKYNLGLTYEDSNFHSLEKQFKRFKNIDPNSFEKSIKSYMHFQSTAQLKDVLINCFRTKELESSSILLASD